ncbi:hypothetical protein PR202_gb05550 [Eleusine coracana subsp. coracana]|uniref:Transmembrane protein n=1 Tax=Eleusine coracana subsp. coracana TaxID=191504 RepID=A0AAV5E864_ELECO|nr:hypothetical protein PR202_gb05550 [Eleusine coracana subsp. coracana]
MDHQQAEAAKSSSSHYDVSLELEPSIGRLFARTADPPVQTTSSGGSAVHPALSFSHDSSRTFFTVAPESRSFARSTSRASSHFCDIEVDEDMVDDRQSVIHGVIDEEMAVVPVVPPPAAADVPGGKKPALAGRSRLGVILLDQGLFTVYKRLFVLFIALNATGLALAAIGRFPYARAHAAVFAMGNILALTLCRSEAVLRVVFWLAVTLFGRSWVPVLVKTGVTAILQSLGGVHSGCGMSSLAWLVYALVQVLQNRDVTPREIVGVASAILGLLALSCMAAFPLVRHLHHNVFERTHRFAGWAALALLWAFVVLSAGYDPATESYNNLTGAVLVKRQELWLTASITFFTILPWLTVRRVPVTVTAHGGDTHAMLAGAVGDFTQGLISDPPSSLWPGAAELSLVWVAKGIEANYGDEMKAAVSRSDQLRGRVLVHDTAVMGRPNVADLAVGAAKKWGAEVVIVTSNPEGSRDVVTGCNMAGIPAFGPIWDS